MTAIHPILSPSASRFAVANEWKLKRGKESGGIAFESNDLSRRMRGT